MAETHDKVSVNADYDSFADKLLLTIHDGENEQTLKFDFDGALRLQQKIVTVTCVMRGNKVACEAVGKVADAEKKMRHERS